MLALDAQISAVPNIMVLLYICAELSSGQIFGRVGSRWLGVDRLGRRSRCLGGGKLVSILLYEVCNLFLTSSLFDFCAKQQRDSAASC